MATRGPATGEPPSPDRAGSVLWGAICVVLVLAFAVWAVHRELTFDQDVRSYMSVVTRHGPALDDAVSAVDSCTGAASCRAALAALRTAASSFEADLADHPAPCSDEANDELWFALNAYLDGAARGQEELSRSPARSRALPDGLFSSAAAHERRANELLGVGGVCRVDPGAAAD